MSRQASVARSVSAPTMSLDHSTTSSHPLTTPVSASLALGSGGARGLAHIGVIQWLADNGYQIRSIAGSSIGALVGGIYASGKLETYAEWVLALERIQVLRLLDPSFSRHGLFKGDRVMGVLRDLIGDCAIEDLPLSYTAVATDLDNGKEVWLRHGKLFDAIRASIATPAIFTPSRLGGRRLVDGALVNPLPIAPTLNDPTDLTIAVNLGGAEVLQAPAAAQPPAPPAANGKGNDYRQRIRAFIESLGRTPTEPEPTPGLFDTAFDAMQVMQDTIARLKLAAYAPDVTIEIPRNACNYFEYWRAKEMIALGRDCAAAAFAKVGR